MNSQNLKLIVSNKYAFVKKFFKLRGSVSFDFDDMSYV